MKIIEILTVLTITVVLSGCEKDLDLKYHDIEPLTVIEAELTSEGLKVEIKLTTPMDEPMDRTLLTDAEIKLTDLTTGDVREVFADNEGVYYDPEPGIVGHQYRLSVKRDGKLNETETVMYPATEIIGLDFNWIKMPYDHVAVFQAQFVEDSSQEGDCYWIKLYKNGEIYLWQEVDDRSSFGGIGTFVTMTSRKNTDEEDDDEALFDGDVMTFSICRITREMHDYLEALQHDSSGPALFSGPRCLGYFIATTPCQQSIVFHPDEIPMFH